MKLRQRPDRSEGDNSMLPNKKYKPADFIQIARRRWPIVVVPAAAGLLLALMVSSKIPNVYQAETLIQVVPQRVPNSFVPSTVTIKAEDRIDSLRQQVESRTQLERIIQDLDLYKDERTHRPMQDVVEGMKSNVDLQTVRPRRPTDPVDAFFLRFTYVDPVVAARVTERLGTLYVRYNAEERGALAEGSKSFLESQLAEAKARLDEQDRRLQAFRERHAGRLPTQLQSNMQAIQATQAQRQSLVESLARDRDRRLMLERLYNDALATPTPVTQTTQAAVDPSQASALSPREQLRLARSALTRLELRLKEGHPDLRRQRKQVADLEREVAALGDSPQQPSEGASRDEVQRQERLSQMRAEIESLDRQITFKEGEERRLSGVIADYQNRIEAVPGVESEWTALTRDYDTLNDQFVSLLQKSQAAGVALDLENRQIGEQFRVVDAPRVPLRPISPMRPAISAGGLFAGFVVGGLLVLLLELTDRSLKSEADVEQVLALPVVAVLPMIVTENDRRRARTRGQLATAAGFAAVAGAGYVFWVMQLWKFVA
jgi:polysaccharide chain length determinant protein (PEP-CTERM system associated)